MDSFELNKIAGAVLFSLLVVIGVGNLSGILFHVDPANPETFPVEIAGADGGAGATEVAEVSLASLLAAASAEKGERQAKKCAACHSFDNGGANKVGPNLWNVVGRAKGSVGGFNYSGAMEAFGGSWGFEELDAYIANPKKYMPGTAMAFAGIKKDAPRADLLAYLREQAASPAPLPAE